MGTALKQPSGSFLCPSNEQQMFEGSTEYWREYGETSIHAHTASEGKLLPPFWKAIWQQMSRAGKNAPALKAWECT